MEARKCTDCLFMIVFLVFLGGMGYMTVQGYLLGDAAYMLAPIAANGMVCGYGAVIDYPFLYVPDLSNAVDPISNYFNYGVCATDCPDGPDSVFTCYEASCAGFTPYDTYEAMNYCIPSAGALNDVYSSGDNGSFSSDNYFVSMYESRWVVLTCIGISLLTALVYLKLMDWFAVPLAWITIVVIEISLCALGYFSWAYMNTIEDQHLGESTS